LQIPKLEINLKRLLLLFFFLPFCLLDRNARQLEELPTIELKLIILVKHAQLILVVQK